MIEAKLDWYIIENKFIMSETLESKIERGFRHRGVVAAEISAFYSRNFRQTEEAVATVLKYDRMNWLFTFPSSNLHY